MSSLLSRYVMTAFVLAGIAGVSTGQETAKGLRLASSRVPARETHRFSRNRARPDDFRQTGLQPARFNQGFQRLLDEDCGSRSPADIISRSCLPAVERYRETL